MADQDRITRLFFELFEGLPRQGPGETFSTLRALALVPNVTSSTRILDLGCGTGAQTRALAKHSPATIVAIDNHPPFVDELNRQLKAIGSANRAVAQVGNMEDLNFASGTFDLIWCEGAIYVIGFDAGLKAWRPLLKPGGHLVVSEACWTKPDPPEECRAFWEQEYPGIKNVEALLAASDGAGYDTIGHFTLPSDAWWNEYYRPLSQNLTEFRWRHREDGDALELADNVQREIDMWKKHGEYYSYEFVVMRVR